MTIAGLLIVGVAFLLYSVSYNILIPLEPSIESELEQGNIFAITNKYENLANGQNELILIETNNQTIKLLNYILATDSGQDEFFIYESPTITDNGVSLTLINRNRNSNTSPEFQAYINTTVSDYGTLLELRYLSSGTKTYSLLQNEEVDLIFKPNTFYLLRIQNNGGGAEDVYSNILFLQ